MTKRSQRKSEPDLAELVNGILADAQKLIQQQFALARQELKEELTRAGTAAATAGAGAGLVGLGAVFAGHMLVQGLHRSTRLPLWGCYGLVGGLLGLAGAGALRYALDRAAAVQLVPPPRTAQTLKEDLAWLERQATGGRA